MQWLIDIVLERIRQVGMFVDRGDPVGFDWTLVSLTKDGAWHDLDLSAIVPENAHTVLFRCTIRSFVIGDVAVFRTKGNINPDNTTAFEPQVANVKYHKTLIVAPNANRVIQYKIDAGPWTIFNLIVRGWWY